MDSEINVQELVEHAARTTGTEISTYMEDLAPGAHQISVEDPSARGAPITLIWSTGGSVVVHIGNGGARLELPLTTEGAAELKRILAGVLLGEVFEKVYASGADLRVQCQGEEVVRLKVRKGIIPRKGEILFERAYRPYGGN